MQAPTTACARSTPTYPRRLGRLPWSRWHRKTLIEIGTVWILDGLEVTVVGSIAGAISAEGSGINISAANVAGLAASMYVAGAAGALLSVAALHIFSPLLNGRVCFGLGFVLGLVILLVRRSAPQEPTVAVHPRA